MAWEKVNWKRSMANQLEAMDKNIKLTCSVVRYWGEEGEEKRKTGANLPPPPQLSLPFN